MDSLLDFLFSISRYQLAVGTAITAAIVAVDINWRLAAVTLFLQFIFVALLLNSALPGNLGLIQLLVGAFSAAILYWTGRRIEDALATVPDGQNWFVHNREIYPMGLPFRFMALILAVLVLWQLPDSFLGAYPGFPRDFVVPAFYCLAMGLLTIILTRDPIKTGMGLLTFLNGFLLLYMLVEVGLMIYGLMGVASILLSLVAGYLGMARHMPAIDAYQATLKAMDPASPEALATAVAALERAQADPPALAAPVSASHDGSANRLEGRITYDE
jgi:hypothetical protein